MTLAYGDAQSASARSVGQPPRTVLHRECHTWSRIVAASANFGDMVGGKTLAPSGRHATDAASIASRRPHLPLSQAF